MAPPLTAPPAADTDTGTAAGPPLEVQLLDSLSRMLRRGHRPANYLLLRLTDGRVKAVLVPDGLAQARAEARRIRNENGPLEVALYAAVSERDGALLIEVGDLASGRRSRAILRDNGGAWRWLGRSSYPEAGPDDRRKSAIFAASLGITIGLLPNAGAIAAPPAVSSCPV